MGGGSPSAPRSGQLCLWRWLADGPEEAPCDPAWRDKSPVTTVMFSPKGRWLATTCTGACKAVSAPVRLWDLSAQGAARGPKPLVHRSALTEPSLLAIAFSADETRLAAAYGYVAELWDLTQPDPPASPVGTYRKRRRLDHDARHQRRRPVARARQR